MREPLVFFLSYSILKHKKPKTLWCIDCEKGTNKQDKEIDEFLSFMTNEQKEEMNKIISQSAEQ
jgi:hypothetical protein